MRIVRQYDINNDKFPCRLDVLYGYKNSRLRRDAAPVPLRDFNSVLKRAIDIDADGFAHVPKTPGIGVEWDWDFIDNCTINIL